MLAATSVDRSFASAASPAIRAALTPSIWLLSDASACDPACACASRPAFTTSVTCVSPLDKQGVTGLRPKLQALKLPSLSRQPVRWVGGAVVYSVDVWADGRSKNSAPAVAVKAMPTGTF